MATQVGGNDIPLLEQESRSRRSNPSNTESPPIVKSDSPRNKPTVSKRRRTTIVDNLRSRKQALFQSVFHLPAVAITIGMTTLTFLNIFWKPPSDNTNIVLNSLQFAAQVHASLIVASLSAMLLHAAHRGMTGKNGVPIGFIISSFQLTAVVPLFRKEFTGLKIKYILIVLLATVIGLLAGPSSAIAMLPRLQFWPMGTLWRDEGSVDMTAYMAATEKGIYPDVLTSNNLPPQCVTSNASLYLECPSYGMRFLLQSDNIFLENKSMNKTIQDTWIRYIIGKLPGSNLGDQSTYMASTLSNFLGRAIFGYQDRLEELASYSDTILGSSQRSLPHIRADGIPARFDLTLKSSGKSLATKKPLVQVQCAGYPATTSSLELRHGQMDWPPWTTSPIKTTNWSIPSSDYSKLSVDINSTIVNSSWINIDQFGEIKPSIGAYFSTPEAFSSGRGNLSYSQYTCTIDARWLSTRAFSDSSNAGGLAAVFDSNPDPIAPLLKYIYDEGPKPETPPSVYINSSWAKALDVPFIDSISSPKVPSPMNRTILDIIGQGCIDAHISINATLGGKPFPNNLPSRIIDPGDATTCLQRVLAIYLSDAIARFQDSIPAYFVVEARDLQQIRRSLQNYSNNAFLVQSLYADLDQDVAGLEGKNNIRLKNITKADLEDSTRFTELRFQIARWGYGYGFEDSILIYVGIVILYIHVALWLAYFVWIMSKGGYINPGWNGLGDLVSMALRSGTAEEQESTVVIKSTDKNQAKVIRRSHRKKWKENIIVREAVVEGASNDQVIDVAKVLVLRRVGQFEGRGDVDVEGRVSTYLASGGSGEVDERRDSESTTHHSGRGEEPGTERRESQPLSPDLERTQDTAAEQREGVSISRDSMLPNSTRNEI